MQGKSPRDFVCGPTWRWKSIAEVLTTHSRRCYRDRCRNQVNSREKVAGIQVARWQVSGIK